MSTLFPTSEGFTLMNEQGVHDFLVSRAQNIQGITVVPDKAVRMNLYTKGKRRIGHITADTQTYHAYSQAANTSHEMSTYGQALKWVAEQWFGKHPARQARKEEFGLSVRA